MAYRSIVLVVTVLIGLTACLGRLTSSEPPRYFEVDYAYQPQACAHRFSEGVRVWHFSASAPFDRDEMIIIDPARHVRFSPQYRWVALPGVMISDRLLEDLVGATLFARTVRAGDPYTPRLQLSGNVFRFAWEESGSSARAVLDVEVSLWSEDPKSDILFRKQYHLESEPVSGGGSQRFAEDMSRLVERMSSQLQQDLCAMLKGSSSPADD